MEEKINKFVEKRTKINDDAHESSLLEYVQKCQEKYKYTLYPHQLNALHRLLTRMNGLGILAMEMGTGKTPTALVYARLYQKLFGYTVIYITPANLETQWQEEGLKFDGQEIIAIDKIRDMKKLQKENPRCRFFIVSPDIFCKLKKFEDGEKFIIVVDEAHTLRNDGKTSVKIQEMMEKIAAFRLLLTATPIINNGGEAFNYLKILFPKVFNDRQAFLDFFFENETDMFGKSRQTKMKHIPLFFKLFDIICIKEYKSEALPNLPPKIRTVYSFRNIDEDLSNLMTEYDALVQTVHRTPGRTKTKQDFIDMGKLANKLYVETEKSKARQCLPMIREILDEHKDEKAVIFFEHKEPLAYILSKIPGSVGLSGDNKPDERLSVIKTMADKKHPNKVLVATIGACGKGYNYSPGVTIVIFVGFAMTYADMYQAEDRCHRAGTDKRILTYWIFCEGSRDKKTLDIIEDKQKTTQALFVGIEQYQEYLSKRQRTIEDDNFFDHWCKYSPNKEDLEKEKQEEIEKEKEETRKRARELEEAKEEQERKKRARAQQPEPGQWYPRESQNDEEDEEANDEEWQPNESDEE